MSNKEIKNVAIISSSFPPYRGGGVTTSHYNLYRKFKEKGFNVKVFTFLDHQLKTTEEDVYRFGTPLFLVKLISILNWLYFKVIKKDVNLAYQLKDILEAAIGSMKINSRLKKFKPDIIILPDHGCPGFFINKMKNCKIIFISHHNPIRFINNPLLGNQSVHDAQLAVKIENKSLIKADIVICPSNYMKEVFKNTYSFNKKLSVIPNIIEENNIKSINPVDLQEKLGLKKETPIIYIPSAFSKFKGKNFVFEIIRRLGKENNEIGFYLSGKYNKDCELIYNLKHLPENIKIYMPGYLDYHENIATIKSCSFCISPTLIESFGMAILEANFCSLPVISFNTGGVSDIVLTAKNGFLAPYLDVEKLIEYADNLLKDKSLLNNMKRNTLIHISNDFLSDNIFQKYLQTIFS